MDYYLDLNKTLTEYSIENATILSRNKSYWLNTITIDEGKKNGIKKDYIKILYSNDDYLYIPVENIDRISKYTGKEGLGVNLSSLSNDNWKKKKGKVREKLESIAGDLIMVSAQREITPGYAFSHDDESQAIFDSEFIYTETPDQIRAINSIKEEIGKTIKKIRLDHSDKIEELALKSGVATSTLSRYENGKKYEN